MKVKCRESFEQGLQYAADLLDSLGQPIVRNRDEGYILDEDFIRSLLADLCEKIKDNIGLHNVPYVTFEEKED